jgi:hypothetical protein
VGNGAMALYAERSWRRSRAANLAVPA